MSLLPLRGLSVSGMYVCKLEKYKMHDFDLVSLTS
jgi:hypothetical protein